MNRDQAKLSLTGSSAPSEPDAPSQ